MATKLLSNCPVCGCGTYIIYPSQDVVCVQCGAVVCCVQRLKSVEHKEVLSLEESLNFWRQELPIAKESDIIFGISDVEQFFMTNAVLKGMSKPQP
jgi:hypothetical protein